MGDQIDQGMCVNCVGVCMCECVCEKGSGSVISKGIVVNGLEGDH